MISTWREIALGDAADIQFGYPFKSAAFLTSPDGPRLLRGDNIGQGKLRWVNAKYWPKDDEATAEYELSAGDVVLAMDRPWIEAGLKYAVVRERDLPAFLVQRVARLRPRPGVANGFLHYVLAHQHFTNYVLGVQTGTAVPHISGGQIRSYSFLLPPLDEQRRIAEVLGALDDLIDTNEQLVERAASLARELFRARFPRFAEPDAAEVSFTEYVDLISGGTPKTSEDSYWGGEIPWFSIVDAPGDNQPWVLRTVKTITQQGLLSSPTNLIPVGSTILSARGTVGKVALVGVPMTMNQSCYALKPRGDATGFFEFFATESVVNRLKAAAHGSVFDTITRQTLESMLVEVVPQEDRAAFNERVEALMTTCRELALENEQLRRTRDEFLPLLMSGAVRVRPEGIAA